MTLDNVVVDCQFISTPGQLGVGLSRATCMDGLQVVGFRDRHVIKHTNHVQHMYACTSLPFLPNLSCCQHPPVPGALPVKENATLKSGDDDT